MADTVIDAATDTTTDTAIATNASRTAAPDDPFVVFSLELKPAAIASLLLDTQDIAPPPPFTGMAVCEAAPELIDAVARLLQLFDEPADLAALAPAYEREILWRLLTGPQGGIVRQIGVSDSTIALIARSIAWMRGHLAEQVPVAELARISGMSVSSFHRHFRAATAMTPVQWQKALRLREARARLLAGGASVADVAFGVGYGSASQFSREYRRAFGVPPGQDGELLRGAATGTAR